MTLWNQFFFFGYVKAQNNPFKSTRTNLSLANPSLSSPGHNDYYCAAIKAAFREDWQSRKGKYYVDKATY